MKFIRDDVSKHTNVFDVLKERGFIEQVTHEKEIRELLGREKIKFYIGFDPTADCLHIGHFMQIIIMMYMQKFGHTPVVLIGGGTGMVGDPSGRTDMRQFMTIGTVQENSNAFKKLLSVRKISCRCTILANSLSIRNYAIFVYGYDTFLC